MIEDKHRYSNHCRASKPNPPSLLYTYTPREAKLRAGSVIYAANRELRLRTGMAKVTTILRSLRYIHTLRSRYIYTGRAHGGQPARYSVRSSPLVRGALHHFSFLSLNDTRKASGGASPVIDQTKPGCRRKPDAAAVRSVSLMSSGRTSLTIRPSRTSDLRSKHHTKSFLDHTRKWFPCDTEVCYIFLLSQGGLHCLLLSITPSGTTLNLEKEGRRPARTRQPLGRQAGLVRYGPTL